MRTPMKTALVLAITVALATSPLAAHAAKPSVPGPPGSGSSTAPAIPSRMAAVGDSLSIGTNLNLTCAILPSTCLPYSWTTGTATSVDSHYLRLRDHSRRITSRNAAYSGATMATLDAQLRSVVADDYDPGYITVLIGANDLCGTSLTPVDAFRAHFTTALTNLYLASPTSSVFVGSIPDLHRLWLLFKDDPRAQSTWAAYGVCPLMLAPGVDQAPVIERQAQYHQVLADVCASFNTAAEPFRCRFDGLAIYSAGFVASDVSTIDYFHPSQAGLTKLAAISWSASYWPAR